MEERVLSKYEREYEPGDIIFCEYEFGDEFYIIKEGRVRIVKIQDNKEKTLDVMGPPSIFGEMAIIEDAPRSATTIAETTVKLVVLKKQNFYELLISNPAWAMSLIKILSKRIFDQTRRIEILSLEENEMKFLDTLLMLSEWKGIIPATYTDQTPIQLTDITADDIAHWSGLDMRECDQYVTKYIKMGKLSKKDNFIVINTLPELYRTVKNKRKMQERASVI
jgi:CRP/FNR family transcriptional regulator, cyclic AMP receptor protein